MVSAGDSRVERLVIEGIGVDTGVRYNKTSWSLPGVPAKAILINDQLIVAAAQSQRFGAMTSTQTHPTPPAQTSLFSVVDGLHGFGSELILTWRTVR